MNVYFDFETRSAADLVKQGLDVYARHETTDALCLAFAIDEGPVHLWKLGETFPDLLFDTLLEGASFIAHNAAFEFGIWNKVCVPKYKWPRLPLENLHCTMAMAYNMGLPGSLDGASKAVGLEQEKDLKGERVMKQLCKPRSETDGEIVWWQEPEKFDILYKYCKQDVVVQRDLFKRLLPLSDFERKTWLLDQKINERGVYVDLPLVEIAMAAASFEKERLDEQMQSLTGGFVSTCQASVCLAEWIRGEGVACEGVAKDAVFEMLQEKDLPAHVRKVLELRKEAAKSSVAKLKAMALSVSSDQRVRGCLQYYGAPATGRWSGRRLQPQNLPRPTLEHDQILKFLRGLERVG